MDIVRAQEVDLRTEEDNIILEWAALQGRIVVTRDRRTMVPAAQRRVEAGHFMPGLIIVHEDLRTGIAIEQILMVAVCKSESEMKDQTFYLPMWSSQTSCLLLDTLPSSAYT